MFVFFITFSLQLMYYSDRPCYKLVCICYILYIIFVNNFSYLFNICQYLLSIFMMLQELATNPDNLLLFTSLVVTTVFVAQVESWLLGTVLFVVPSLSIEENRYLFFVWRKWLTINTFIISALFLCPLWHISFLSWLSLSLWLNSISWIIL